MLRRMLIVVAVVGAATWLIFHGLAPRWKPTRAADAGEVHGKQAAASSTTAATQKAPAIGEEDAEDRVGMVPVVARYLDSVSRDSHGQGNGLLFSEGAPADDPNVWQVYAGEDYDDDGARCWCKFRVNRRSGAIMVSPDGGREPWIPLEQWEKQLPTTRK